MTRVLGTRTLVAAVTVPSSERLLGVALFFVPGVVGASVARDAGRAKRAERAMEQALVVSAGNPLPPVVAVAVTTRGVRVFPAGFNGHVSGPQLAFWPNRGFTARALRTWPMVRLRLGLPDARQALVECKTFPVGPNRYNRRVARLVQEAAGIPASHRD